jgi:predicted transcriptional regulator
MGSFSPAMSQELHAQIQEVARKRHTTDTMVARQLIEALTSVRHSMPAPTRHRTENGA